MPKIPQHLDPHLLFSADGYYEQGNPDKILAHHPELANRPHVTLTIREAYEQGILTEKGVHPNWIAVVPVYAWKPDCYLVAHNAFPRKNGTFDVECNQPNLCGRSCMIDTRLNPKARLHIVVNC